MTQAPHTLAWWTPNGTAPDLNGPATRPFDRPDPLFLSRPVFATFEMIVGKRGDAVALREGARTLRFREAHERAVRLATRIARTVPPGEAVAVLLRDEIEIAVAMLACFASGRVCLPISADDPAERIAHIIAEAAPRALIVGDGANAPSPLPDGVEIIAGAMAETVTSDAAFSPNGLDEAANVIHTSGSTGQPKGIVRSQRQLLVRVLNKILQFHVEPSDRILSIYSLTSGPGLTAAMMALMAGAELHLTHVADIGARRLLGLVQERRITIISAIPSVLRLLLALPGAGEAFARVRGIFTASESVLRSDIDAWRRVLPADCGIALAYGLTEGSPLSDWFVPREFPGTEARLPVGYPIAWHEFAIADAAGQPVRDGEVGELWVRGRLLSLGEWRQGRCSPGRLLAGSDDPSRLVLRTGDLVRLRPDGLMEFVGRTDAMVKIRGNRVELAEIEDVIRRIPGVADVATIAHESDAETTLVAFVVLKKSDPDGLRHSLAQRLRALLPAYMVPARIEFLDALPRLSGGKIDARALATTGSRPERRSGSFGGLGHLWARRS